MYCDTVSPPNLPRPRLLIQNAYSQYCRPNLRKGRRDKGYDSVHSVSYNAAAPSNFLLLAAIHWTLHCITRAALQHAYPHSLTVRQIRKVIGKYQPWRIQACRGEDKKAAAEVRPV